MERIIKIIFRLGCVFFISGCINNPNQIRNEAMEKIKFSCQEIYIDTSYDFFGALFKIRVSNQTNNKYYYFSNPSPLNKDSVYSNFYLQDTLYNLKFQLFLQPILNPLYPKKVIKLPVILAQQATWNDLKRIKSNSSLNDSNSKIYLAINFLKQCRLIYVSEEKDFLDHHIKLKYLIDDTIHISFSDSTPVYFNVLSIQDFKNDSLFRHQHPPKAFLIRKNKEQKSPE